MTPKTSISWWRASLILVAAVLLLAVAPRWAWGAPAGPKRQVLILNSYHPTYAWTQNITRGALSVLDAMGDVEVNIEFMDSKKVFTPEYATQLSEVYAKKYGSMRFDLILSSDDDALNFLKAYRDKLFPGVPVVFCGVNSFEDARIEGFSNVTGVNEEQDFDKNLEWIARIRPSTKQIVFVVDESATSQGAIRRIKNIEVRWQQRFAIRFISNVTVAELEQQLRALPEDAVVFWEMFMRDRANTPLSMAESHRLVVAASPVPVFGFTDVSVAEGAVGGYVVSGFSQGETAARLGARILAGTPAAALPVVRESPNVYMLDYPAFKRWNLDTENLPPGTVVQNRPFSFYERYRYYVWAAFGGMGAESLVILVLISTIRTLTRKSRAKLRQSEERYRSIVEDGSELICRFNEGGTVVFVNGALARFAHQAADAMVGRSFWSLLTESTEISSRPEVDQLTPDNPVIAREQAYRTGSGEQRWVLWTYRGLFHPDGPLTEVQAVGHDITARRDAELAVRAALQQVEEGNAALGRLNGNLQGVLDSMREGLLVCDLRGLLTPTRSRAALAWFGSPEGETYVWDYLFDGESQEMLRFRAAFEQLAEDFLPFEMGAAQLPRMFRRGERTYSVGCHQVIRDGRFAEVVFIIADVTEQLEQDQIHRINRELPIIVGNLLRDREGFQEFVQDTAQMLARLDVVSEGVEVRRLLHTLKGNTAIYGFGSFASRCHDVEDAIENDDEEPTHESIENLTAAWNKGLESFNVFFNREGESGVRLTRNEYEDVLTHLESGSDHGELLELARSWNNPLMSEVLGIYARTIRQLAQQFAKEIEPQILDHDLRLPAAEMRLFLGVLVHVVRNAVDHGIESPDDRERAGKSRVGRLSIESKIEGPEFVVAVEDDGRGIDWDTVRARAEARALPVATSDDLVEALFVDGLTTRNVVTDVSGRGVGLGAVRHTCQQFGGAIRIASQKGKGTRFEFRFALPGGPATEPRRAAEDGRGGSVAA
jgi:PAS domain S-box-containing protein